MKLSSQGLELIKRWEGDNIEGGMHVAYRCSAGVPTIGYGHTHGVQMGDTISQEQADQLLYDDVHDFEAAVNRLVRVSINQNEFDALISFTFNLGSGALSGSTLLRVLNEGDHSQAAANFQKWVYSKPVIIDPVTGKRKPTKGLVARRKAEEALFRKPINQPAAKHPELEEQPEDE